MRIVFSILAIAICLSSLAQKKGQDSIVKKPFFHNIFDQLKRSVTVSKSDSVVPVSVLNTRSESPFVQYEGKVIRHIITDELGFEKTFTDTTKRIQYFGTKILNALHANTKKWVIHENLFIKENSRINAFKLADNERYLRSLEFIQDARILVKPIRGSTDSVDLLIVTKDLFSITGSVSASGFSRIKTRAEERNLAGMGQELQIATLFDKSRSPALGYDISYTKRSIAGTFIDGTVGYSLINTGPSEGLEDENSFYLRLVRPLISPFSTFTGGFEMSFNASQNLIAKPDSIYYDYKYHIYDGWLGVNLGTTKLLATNNEYRNRKFLSVRYFSHHFGRKPLQVGDKFDPIYNDKRGILGEFTFFRQEFAKTNYIFGFGVTEDVPYGYNIALTGGWFKQLDLARPYVGVNANRYVFTQKGEFFQYFLRSGAFLNKKKFEDASLLVGANLYSKVFVFKGYKMRNYFKGSYTNISNRITSEQLRIDNPLGISYFRSDSLLGAQRLSFHTETFLISNYKFFGFQFSPFLFANVSFLSKEKQGIFNSEMYSGLGGGARTRNENLIFGTVELRLMYFPRVTDQMNTFKVRIKSNLRFRYNSRYIKAPDFIQLNNDEANDVY